MFKKKKKQKGFIEIRGFAIDPRLAQDVGRDKRIKKIRKNDLYIGGDKRKHKSIIACDERDFERLEKRLRKYLKF